MAQVHLELVRGEGRQGEGPEVAPAARAALAAAVAEAAPQRVRIVDAALACIARQGLTKTTVDDIARQAGCSRATVYRVFPGGKDAIVAAVADTEIARCFSAVAVRMGAARDLEEVLVGGMVEAARQLTGHEALAYLLGHEPELILPHLTFSHMDVLLARASSFAAPFLGRWLPPEEAARVGEWATRILLSYLACPAEGVDLTDETCTARLVRTFVLPGIDSLRVPAGGAAQVVPPRSARSQTATTGPTSRTTRAGRTRQPVPPGAVGSHGPAASHRVRRSIDAPAIAAPASSTPSVAPPNPSSVAPSKGDT